MILGEEYGSALLEKYKKQLYKIFNPTNKQKKFIVKVKNLVNCGIIVV